MRRVAAAGALALLAVLLGLAIAAGATLSADRMVWAATTAHRGPRLVAAAAVLTIVGKVAVRAPVAAGVVWWLARRGRGPAATALVVAVAGGELLVQLVKLLVGRPRPPGALVAAAGTSFPSGHAAGCMILFPLMGAMLAVRRPAAGAAAGVALAVAVGLTRVLLGVHWASDVATGWLIGGAVALLAAAAVRA